MAIDKESIRNLIGDPRRVDRELRSFQKAARALSSKHPRMIDRYPNQWVAVYRGDVRSSASTLKSLLRKVDKAKLPRQEVIVRYIDRNQRTLIL